MLEAICIFVQASLVAANKILKSEVPTYCTNTQMILRGIDQILTEAFYLQSP